jgi:hypothetical protein
VKKPYDTLVLNKHWAAVHIIGYRRCISLIYQGHARPLDDDFIPYTYEDWVKFSTLPKVLDGDYATINTVSMKIAVPDIIVLNDYAKLNAKDVKYSRENLFHRDKFICQYCGKMFKRDELTVDHIIPKSLGGNNDWCNVVASCRPCNSKKADRTIKQAGMKLLKYPTEPKWFSPIHKVSASPNIRTNWKKFLKIGGV